MVDRIVQDRAHSERVQLGVTRLGSYNCFKRGVATL